MKRLVFRDPPLMGPTGPTRYKLLNEIETFKPFDIFSAGMS